jgi:hypothetical protein
MADGMAPWSELQGRIDSLIQQGLERNDSVEAIREDVLTEVDAVLAAVGLRSAPSGFPKNANWESDAYIDAMRRRKYLVEFLRDQAERQRDLSTRLNPSTGGRLGNTEDADRFDAAAGVIARVDAHPEREDEDVVRLTLVIDAVYKALGQPDGEGIVKHVKQLVSDLDEALTEAALLREDCRDALDNVVHFRRLLAAREGELDRLRPSKHISIDALRSLSVGTICQVMNKSLVPYSDVENVIAAIADLLESTSNPTSAASLDKRSTLRAIYIEAFDKACGSESIFRHQAGLEAVAVATEKAILDRQ